LERGGLNARCDQGSESFDARCIFLREARWQRAIEINDCDHLARTQHRDDQLRTARRIAGNMAGKGVDIINKLRGATLRRCPAHALAKGDADAGWLADKWAKHQFRGCAILGCGHTVKARPVEIWQKFPQERGNIRHIGNSVRLIAGQRIGRAEQLGVELAAIKRISGLKVEHSLVIHQFAGCRKGSVALSDVA
jgi:hypothetical protein